MEEGAVARVTENKVLLVCGRGEEKLRQLLSGMGLSPGNAVPSAGEARRMLARGGYGMVIINAPLADESGLELAMELTGGSLCAVVLLVKAELMGMIYDPATEAGVLVAAKPLNPQIFQQTVQLAEATRNRLLLISRENEKLHQKLEEMRLVDRAKCLLIEHEHLSEGEAHRAIEKQAMDARLSRAKIAKAILERYEL